MTVSLYSVAVPPMLQILGATSGQLTKARAFCAEQGVAEAELAEIRLAPDMWPFSWQVRACVTYSASAVQALESGRHAPDFCDVPADFDVLEAMVADAIAVLRGVSPEAIDKAADKDVLYTIHDFGMNFTGADFITSFTLPSFHFHASMVYAILRNQGLTIGKRDFLGRVRRKA